MRLWFDTKWPIKYGVSLKRAEPTEQKIVSFDEDHASCTPGRPWSPGNHILRKSSGTQRISRALGKYLKETEQLSNEERVKKKLDFFGLWTFSQEVGTMTKAL